MGTRTPHLGWVLVATAVASIACAAGRTFTAGSAAEEDCAVRPLSHWLGDAKVVSTVCGPSLWVGSRRFYVHAQTSQEPVLHGAKPMTDPKLENVGTSRQLRDLEPEERAALLQALSEHGMQTPPKDAAYGVWDVDIFADPAWQSWVEVLRSGDDVWITAEIAGAS